MNLGQHAFFIIAAYAIVAVVVLALIGWVIADHRRLTAALRNLDARGAKLGPARHMSGSR